MLLLCYFIGGAVLQGFIGAPKGTIRREVAEKVILSNTNVIVSSVKEGLEKAIREKYGVLSSTSEFSSVSRDPCSFMEIPYNVEVYEIAFGFPKQSPFIHIFNYFLTKNIENGNLKRIASKWKRQIPCEKGADLNSMGFANVISAFYMIFGGFILTTIIFFIEISMKKNKERRRISTSLQNKNNDSEGV